MFVNLTPHTVTVFRDDVIVAEFAPSGTVARVATETRAVGHLDGIPAVQVAFGQVEGLPGPRAGVYYIVSSFVFDALPERIDLVVPADLVRDEAGRVVGCRAFRARLPGVDLDARVGGGFIYAAADMYGTDTSGALRGSTLREALEDFASNVLPDPMSWRTLDGEAYVEIRRARDGAAALYAPLAHVQQYLRAAQTGSSRLDAASSDAASTGE